MGSGGDGSAATTSTEHLTFSEYISERGMAFDPLRFKVETYVLKRFSEELERLSSLKNVADIDISEALSAYIRKITASQENPNHIKNITSYNPFIMLLALRNKGLLAACRSKTMAPYWHECAIYENQTHFKGDFPACPKDRKIFDHMMGVHLNKKAEDITREVDSQFSGRGDRDGYRKIVKSLAYREVYQKALGYFLQAARLGSISAVYHIIDFYKDMLRFADISPALTHKLLSYAETLAQTLPTALGSLGYLYMVQTYSCLSECIEQYGIKRLGLSTEQVGQRIANYSDAQMLALLKAEKLRFHETSVEIFKGHEESLERHRKRLSADTTSSFGEDTQMWTRLITYYVPFRYFLNGTGYDLRHDTVFLPAFDEKGVVPSQYAKLLSKEGLSVLNTLSKQTNEEATMLERIHETLDFEPFADVASDMILNLDFTQPAKQIRYFQPAPAQRQPSQSSEHSLTLNFA